MEYEKLLIGVGATRAGLKPVLPRVLRGVSGVEHRFNMLFTDGARQYAFDIYESIRDFEVVKSYLKKFDTGASVFLVCPTENVSWEARSLAVGYDMKILSPESIPVFFALEPMSPQRSLD
ncbi:MAG: hypothetical protein KGI38_02920 [Thaumarchaeota archaeon]|nr:hypothetical protein [Nitrososphaerota archaeon]